MSSEEKIDQFIELTAAERQKASQYLAVSDNNLEQAVALFYETGGIDLDNQSASVPTSSHGPSNPIPVDSDPDDDDVVISDAPPTQAQHPAVASYEDDEAMARRLQEEAYGVGAPGAGGAGEDGVRAPIGRTTETLVGGPADWREDPGQFQSAIAEQMMARQQRRAAGRPGIFNQQPSVWENSEETPNPSVQVDTASNSNLSNSKANMLAEMYRPPFEIMSRASWDAARDEGKESLKWIIVNVQDPSIFDCQVLNRDIWKNAEIKETIKESFIFLQYNKDDPRGDKYMQYYFHNRESQDAYPHIAIVDPRTGEQVKVWSGPPVPKPLDFLGQLHEFLDRYSLKANARNPVAKAKPEKKQKDVGSMTEEEMLEMALQNSLANNPNGGPRDDDPDALTKLADKGKGKATVIDPTSTGDAGTPGSSTINGVNTSIPIADTLPPERSAFSTISSTDPHTEPAADPATTTRIQFRSSGSRVIRRFSISDPVVRLYEWIKATPWEGKAGLDFELSFMGKNLMEDVQAGKTVEQAGLKNGQVMVEFSERD
ncbi:MAG: hypothetical protein M1821_001019 [Bathelium mastoideum]|nr:MAG: hypothetical protein M1821_001019 [Bathelium mastoideum]